VREAETCAHEQRCELRRALGLVGVAPLLVERAAARREATLERLRAQRCAASPPRERSRDRERSRSRNGSKGRDRDRGWRRSRSRSRSRDRSRDRGRRDSDRRRWEEDRPRGWDRRWGSGRSRSRSPPRARDSGRWRAEPPRAAPPPMPPMAAEAARAVSAHFAGAQAAAAQRPYAPLPASFHPQPPYGAHAHAAAPPPYASRARAVSHGDPQAQGPPPPYTGGAQYPGIAVGHAGMYQDQRSLSYAGEAGQAHAYAHGGGGSAPPAGPPPPPYGAHAPPTAEPPAQPPQPQPQPRPRWNDPAEYGVPRSGAPTAAGLLGMPATAGAAAASAAPAVGGSPDGGGGKRSGGDGPLKTAVGKLVAKQLSKVSHLSDAELFLVRGLLSALKCYFGVWRLGYYSGG